MIIKICLFIVIIGLSGLLGILKAYKYKERCRLIQNFIDKLEYLRVEMEYRRAPLPEIFRKCGDGDNEAAYLFYSVSERMKSSGNRVLNHIWKHEINEIYDSTPLTSEDLEIFISTGEELGSTGTTGQHKIIEMTLIKLEKQLENAEEERNKKEKMYASLGFMTGITIVILLA